jgi:hypothetical protein
VSEYIHKSSFQENPGELFTKQICENFSFLETSGSIHLVAALLLLGISTLLQHKAVDGTC